MVHELGLQYFHDQIAVGTATAFINFLVGKVLLPQDSPMWSLAESGIAGMYAIVVYVGTEGRLGSTVCQSVLAPAAPNLASPLSAAQASAASPKNTLVGISSLNLLPVEILLVLVVIEALGIILATQWTLAKAGPNALLNAPAQTSASRTVIAFSVGGSTRAKASASLAGTIVERSVAPIVAVGNIIDALVFPA